MSGAVTSDRAAPTRAGAALGNGAASKITSAHLERSAFIYIRQSTLRQVMSNTESTARQYALKQRAISLGWQPERVITIDSDQGQSGANAADRAGFQKLVAEVGLGRAGIVLGLEVSRLARNNALGYPSKRSDCIVVSWTGLVPVCITLARSARCGCGSRRTLRASTTSSGFAGGRGSCVRCATQLGVGAWRMDAGAAEAAVRVHR